MNNLQETVNSSSEAVLLRAELLSDLLLAKYIAGVLTVTGVEL